MDEMGTRLAAPCRGIPQMYRYLENMYLLYHHLRGDASAPMNARAAELVDDEAMRSKGVHSEYGESSEGLDMASRD